MESCTSGGAGAVVSPRGGPSRWSGSGTRRGLVDDGSGLGGGSGRSPGGVPVWACLVLELVLLLVSNWGWLGLFGLLLLLASSRWGWLLRGRGLRLWLGHHGRGRRCYLRLFKVFNSFTLPAPQWDNLYERIRSAIFQNTM